MEAPHVQHALRATAHLIALVTCGSLAHCANACRIAVQLPHLVATCPGPGARLKWEVQEPYAEAYAEPGATQDDATATPDGAGDASEDLELQHEGALVSTE